MINRISDILEAINQKWCDIKFWILYRLSKEYQYHIMYTKLKPGYHEFSYRILYAMMNDFVSRWPETKKAYSYHYKEGITEKFDEIQAWWEGYEKAEEATLNCNNWRKADKLEKKLEREATRYMKYLIEHRNEVDW